MLLLCVPVTRADVYTSATTNVTAPCQSDCCASNCKTTLPSKCVTCCSHYTTNPSDCNSCLTNNGCKAVPTPAPPGPGPSAKCFPEERDLLCGLYTSTSVGDGWAATCKKGWEWCSKQQGTPLPCCEWTGVTCNSAGHMTIVQLGGCNLQGAIAVNSTGHSIFSLPELKEFHAEAAGEGALCTSSTTRKGIGGKLPADLKDAVNLQVLGLYCNVMTGSLAALEALAQLVQIDVHFNKFVGLLPSLVKSKASLLYLSVANNKLTGPISADYAMMSKMTTFGVAFNRFTGPVYKIITALPQLTVIYARGNSFSGVLPPPGAAAAVYDMDSNKFTEFPANICQQPLPGIVLHSH